VPEKAQGRIEETFGEVSIGGFTRDHIDMLILILRKYAVLKVAGFTKSKCAIR
jgi:hypothetical protein